MTYVKILYRFGSLILALILLFGACSPKSSYGVKSFLFDGVPNPYEEEHSLALDSLNTVQQDNAETPIIIGREPTFNLHPPYQEKKCNTCHVPDSMGDLLTSSQELCFTCHDDFNDIFSYVHGPVASGNCTECHNPHQSKLESLLVTEGQTLCFKCHIQQKVENYKIHDAIEETNCTVCHNPHGGQNKYILQNNACYECHDNFEEKYSILHGPVSAGFLCNTCHENHDSKKPNLLNVTGKELCLNCHNLLDIYSTQTHKEAEKQDCIKCHNPHGSQQNYLLTKLIKE